jgi:hypothetical protein
MFRKAVKALLPESTRMNRGSELSERLVETENGKK